MYLKSPPESNNFFIEYLKKNRFFARLFATPVYENDELTRKARLLHMILVVTVFLATTLLTIGIFSQPEVMTKGLVAILGLNLLAAISIAFNRARKIRVAALIFICGFLVMVIGQSIQVGGVRSPGVQSFFIFAMISALVLGEKGGLIVAVSCSALSLGLVLAETLGYLPPQTVFYTPWVLWLINTMYVGILCSVLIFFSRTLRKALQEKQQELTQRAGAEKRLELALAASGAGVWEQDIHTGDFYGDKRACEIFRLERPENGFVSFETWRGLVHPADLADVLSAFEGLRQGANIFQAKYRIIWPDKTVRYINAAATSLRDAEGRTLAIVGTIFDNTEQQESQKEKERLVTDLGERVKELRLLHSTAQLLSYRPFHRNVLEELIQQIPSAMFRPDICEARIAVAEIEVKTPNWSQVKVKLAAPFSTLTGDGLIEVGYRNELRLTENETIFLREEKDLIDSLAEMLATYLRRDQAEKHRRALEADLRQAQKMEALGTLAGGIAHDFNNILTAILGNAEIGLMQFTPEQPARRLFEEIELAGSRAKDLVKSILVFSRRTEPQRKSIELPELINEVVKLLRASLPAMIKISVENAKDLPIIQGDVTQIHQVLMNLGTNAAYAMPEGGLLSFETETCTVDPLQSDHVGALPGNYVKLIIRDTGSGIPAEILDRIFEPFFTTKGDNGTGLGLSVVHGIIRDHNGHIQVTSELGQGTMFSILLPIDSGNMEMKRPISNLPRGDGQRIMYVDDEEPILKMMKRLLELINYQCFCFTDPIQALSAFKNDPDFYDVLISDGSMPGMTGLELIRKIRKIRSNMPVLIASGYENDKATVVTEFEDIPLLGKPPTLEDVAIGLNRVLKR